MTFAYSARDPLGKMIQGSLEAANREDAAQVLRRDGFQVIQIEESAENESLQLFPRRIKKIELIYMASQLAIMVETGITLSVALEGICQQEENPTLKSLLLDLKKSVEGGEDFSSSLAKHPKHFDTTFVALVRASEQTGKLGEMLQRIADYLRKEVETRGKVRAAMAYPAVMLFVATGVTIFLLTFVLPKFTPLFESKHVTLPMPTIVMMMASKALIQYWYLWIIGAVLAIVGFIFGRRTEMGRQMIDWSKLNAPILGPLFRKVTISRCIRTLGTMIESGVSMLDAIELTAEVSGNYFYQRVWRKVLDEVTSGNQICDALAGNPLFPSTLVQMIGSGEETGKLDMVLDRVSAYYDQEVELSIKTATSMIEPIMITVMGVIVGGIALGLLLPIFSLSRAH